MTDSPQTNLLIVEDEALILDLAVMTLEESDDDANIMQAMNVEQALARLEGIERLDALITDIQMPGAKDGLDLATMVRKRYPDCAIVLVSGRPLPTDRPLPPESRYVPKPWSPSDLVSVVQKEMAAHRVTP